MQLVGLFRFCGNSFQNIKLTRIDFYYDVKDTFLFASRITRKLYYDNVVTHEHPLVIRCKNQPQCDEFTESVHHFSERDFIPLVNFSDKNAKFSPIILLTQSEIPFWADDIVVLLNLDAKIEMTFSSYSRVIEIVDQSEVNRQKGREKYKFYKERGYEVFNHKVDK